MIKANSNNSMLFKMRDERLYVLLMDREGDFIFYDRDDIKSGYSEGTIMFEDYDDDFLAPSSDEYDIMAIKQYDSCVAVISEVLDDIEPEEWDWVREVEKSVESVPSIQNFTINITIDPHVNVDDLIKQLTSKLNNIPRTCF